MLYVFDMATDQGHIFEQAGVTWKTGCNFDIYNDCMTFPEVTLKGQTKVKKIQIVQICCMTSDKAIFVIGTQIGPVSHEIQALKIG